MIRVRAMVNQCMDILNPFFAIPARTRDGDRDLSDAQRATIDDNELIINDLMEKVQRKMVKNSKNNQSYRQSSFHRSMKSLQDIYLDIYREQWGGFHYYDDVEVEPHLRKFQARLNELHLHQPLRFTVSTA
jgi:hypothetical protein